MWWQGAAIWRLIAALSCALWMVRQLQNERIQWAPKVPQAKIWALYQSDARGLADQALIDDVGFALFQRCQSIIMVTERRQVICPRCARTVSCQGEGWSREQAIMCHDCGWSATYGQYRDSWRHQDLQGGNAMYAFRAFMEGYQHALPRERMLLIDRLINAFHWSLKHQRMHGPAATQLIAGGAEQVLMFLDRLAGNLDSAAGQLGKGEKEDTMLASIPAPDPITPAWLTAALRASGALARGEVLELTSSPTGAFNSQTSHLQLRYSDDTAPELTPNMVLKRNIPAPWGVEAGAQEVAFYQLIAMLPDPPPGIVPCYAAAYDRVSGDSYLLLQDLSATHSHPVTRDQQIGITESVPAAHAIERVVDALAQHHAYWWDHALLTGTTFEIGYWSRNAERFRLYVQRRRVSWDSLLANEVAWFPGDLRDLYVRVLDHLEQHWQRYLEPRFQAKSNLTLVHGDAYFPNFLCPNDPHAGATYLLDWQEPTVDIGGYDLVNLCATFWTSEQRHTAQREQQILRRYHATLQAYGVKNYAWDDLLTDYRSGLIFWLLMPVQDCYGGAGKEYWWPKMQCLVAAFREWRCEDMLGIAAG